MQERNFVLIPLVEIFQKNPISNVMLDLMECLEKNKFQKVIKIGEFKVE
jgi:hypothetical protein